MDVTGYPLIFCGTTISVKVKPQEKIPVITAFSPIIEYLKYFSSVSCIGVFVGIGVIVTCGAPVGVGVTLGSDGGI